MSDAAMTFLSNYGAFALFGILALGSLGVPLPSSLVLLMAGSLVARGQLDLVSIFAWGIAGAVLGDQAGYLIGRLGSEGLAERLAERLHMAATLDRARTATIQWGAISVFLSRWLLSPLGPGINIVAGMMAYPWSRFTAWGVFGEAIWVFQYVGLGILFSRSILAVADILGDLTWFFVFAVVAVLLGVKILYERRIGSASLQSH
ncbi:membrane protein DedA with SNARE-associated domain [Aminobacter lissarensis]|uniref:Membrane protein DedA with SNARE-associated domain n=1 Tax=Aminobacter carboxidus TaxID=376165 RepID=A0A8E1WKT2_9HYPH|nr:DedA family protein [Aminobacter lissarensis]MBB6469769.1 membrane protein DedA with SNARE-associated domain [Aminobacter lissarensis]